MKRTLFILIAAMLLCGVAQGGVPGVRTEFGVVAGVDHPVAKFDMASSSAMLKANTGFTVGVHMGLRIAGILAIQPEVLYSYNKIALNDEKRGFSTDIKCNTVQIPVLVSLRLGLVRLNIGPVFNVVDNPTYLDRNSEKVLFGPLRPTLSYAAGVSVCLLQRLLIDARVSSGFKAMENCISYDAKSEGEYIKTTMINAQLKVGVLF